ncbi:MAG: cation transporter, partial [Chloroflexi bacterium]|nr:cation transporter [Chloroflexota bacterium]
MVKDPVCGMEIEPQSAFASREHMGQVYYFCSENCLSQFDKNPHQFAVRDQESLAGSITTGFNPDLDLAQVELPIVGLKKDGRPGAGLIRMAFEKQPGVDKVAINPIEGVAIVRYDPKEIKFLDLVKVVKKSGYQVGGAQKRIGIENLHCASCVQFIENELEATPGVLDANVNIATQEATIEYLPEQTSLPRLNAAIESWGYKTRTAASELPTDSQETAHEKEYRSLMNKFWLAAVVSIPVLLTAY